MTPAASSSSNPTICRRAFRRIDEDNQFHYLLTYSPTQHHVRRQVPMRFASRCGGRRRRCSRGAAIARICAAAATRSRRRSKAPALAMLDGRPAAQCVPRARRRLQLPGSGTTRPDADRSSTSAPTRCTSRSTSASRPTRARSAIVVRVQDAAGPRSAEVSASSTCCPATRADVDAARQGDIIFYRELDLDPGVYTIEIDRLRRRRAARQRARHDADRSGRRRPRGPAMSSLVLVNRVEETADAPASAASRPPLYVGQHAALSEPRASRISKAAVKELPFYFTLYGDAHGRDASPRSCCATASRSPRRR